MPQNPQKEQPAPGPDALRDDLPWKVVEGIEPEDDVLSKLTAEDESGRPTAAGAAIAPDRRAAPERPVMRERYAVPERPAATGRAGTLDRPAPPERLVVLQRSTLAGQPAVPAPSAPLDRRGVEPRPADAGRAGQPGQPSTARVGFQPLQLIVATLLVAAAVVGAVWLGGARWLSSAVPSRANGTLVIESRPAGALVAVDGEARGRTPVSVSVEPGRHTFVLTGAGTRERTVTVDPGSRVLQYIEMPESAPTGTLRVETSIPGAQVSVDGTPRGATPLDVGDLAPGAHVVTLRLASTTVTQNVTVRAGEAVSLVVPLSQTESASPGWVAVTSPIELQLYDGERLVGTSRADRVLMLAGRYDLRLVNLPLGFETTRVVQVSPNRVTTLAVEPPNGALFVNAVPWAEVFMDGAKIGDTPIANYPARLGSHEIVLRHPKFPERRLVVTVSLAAPARVGVDLQK